MIYSDCISCLEYILACNIIHRKKYTNYFLYLYIMVPFLLLHSDIKIQLIIFHFSNIADNLILCPIHPTNLDRPIYYILNIFDTYDQTCNSGLLKDNMKLKYIIENSKPIHF